MLSAQHHQPENQRTNTSELSSKKVLQASGDDEMVHYSLNRLLLSAFLSLQILQLAILPGWLLDENLAWGWLLLFSTLLTNTWWSLIHEAIHGSLLISRTANRVAGRIQAILYGCPFHVLRWGHLLHHAYSRTERERSEVYRGSGPPPFAVRAAYYFRLLGGLYCLEVLAGFLLLLPRRLVVGTARKLRSEGNVVELLSCKVLDKNTYAQARLDAALILALYGGSFVLYGRHGWMLLLALIGRGFLISLVDNVFHYATPLDQTHYARNLRLPAWISACILHFNLHGIHHLNPSLPWWKLPRQHSPHRDGYQGYWLASLLSQFKGPIPEDRLYGARQDWN